MAKVLLIERTPQEHRGNPQALEISLSEQIFILMGGKYEVSVARELSEITEEMYSSQDCVLIHPTPEKLRRILGFRVKYPRVGLIITTGLGRDEEPLQTFHKDSKGIYFLAKPFTMNTYIGAIERVIAEAKETAYLGH